jgi:L-seryl-tRNA(Ser) seleniumtransferase
MTDVRRAIPAVHRLLDDAAFAGLINRFSRTRVAHALRAVADRARHATEVTAADAATWAALVEDEIARNEAASVTRVINATGVVLHTNLGRAPLPDAAVQAIAQVAAGYANIEFDLATGKRGERQARSRGLLVELTGAEDALVVNNCASALLLALRALGSGRDVLVSRGELIEIGGSFRIPDIMLQADVRLVEVGTTNRTHLDDYRRALNPSTGAIVKVHRSNFTMDGFVRDVSVRDLSSVAAEAGIPLIHDLGSGLMIDLAPWGLAGEPTAADAIRDGADVVVMSGDKLLGGPQAGLVIGKREWITRIVAHPFARAVRVDKITLAALEATLALYGDSGLALREVPALAMITATREELIARAERLVDALLASGVPCSVAESEGAIGGGAFPAARLPSAAILLDGDPRLWEAALRASTTPVIGRIADGAFLLDVRTVRGREEDQLIAAVTQSVRRLRPDR